jgi:two-component system response regulator FlrC
MRPVQVVLVEDDPELRQAIGVTLKFGGIDFEAFDSAEAVLAALTPGAQPLLVTDFKLPGMNGLQLMAHVRQQHPQLPVVVMTAFADAELAVQALKGGARDFLIKPFLPEQLIEVIHRHLPSPAVGDAETAAIIATDPATLAALQRCDRVANTDATVLLTGESGVGKDVFARRLHTQSARKARPYVAINCAAIPENLLESTLFGYEKGAFTGAVRSQAGKFEQAHGGTLFLDEIGEMPLELQAKLLRVLQDQMIERLGALRATRCDVRIVAATNQDLQQRVSDGRFRSDLYFRLAVVPIRIPPLRDRSGDILPLAHAFLARYSHSMGRETPSLSPQAQTSLQAWHWPGNIRELENAMQRAVLMCDGQTVSPADIELDGQPPSAPEVSPPGLGHAGAGTNIACENTVLRDIESVEREHILKVLAQVGGNRKEAVAVLGLSERALRYKLKAYQLTGLDEAIR